MYCAAPTFLIVSCKWGIIKASLERDKGNYKLLANRCTQANNKYLAAKELEMIVASITL